MINHGQAVRSLVLHDAGCLFSLPLRSIQVLWLAAGIGTGRPGSPTIAAQTLHMSTASERTAEARAITQLRSAGRHGCKTAAASPSAVVTGPAVSVPITLITTAARTVGSQPSSASAPMTIRSRRGGRSHHPTGNRHASRTALQTAAISPNPHNSMLLVWALLLFGVVGLSATAVAGRRPSIQWAGGVAASRIAALRRARRGRTLESSASVKEITPPADGWAPPLFAHNQAAPIKDITPPADGWAPPLFAHDEAAPMKDITPPADGWAPPIHGLTPPVAGTPSRVLPSGPRGRTVTRWRELRAHAPATLGVAGGALAAILAVATKPQRGIGRRHR